MHGEQTQRPRAKRASGGHVLALALRRDDAPHAARHDRPADERKDADEQREHVTRRQHQRHHGAQREHDVDRGKDEHEIRESREDLVDGASREAGDAANRGAEDHGGKRREDRETERGARPVEQPREDVATV